MADRVTTILQVEFDGAKVAQDLAELSRQIANVKNEQKKLDDEYKTGKVSLADYTAETAAMKDELTWLQKEQKGVIATTKLLTATGDTYADSLNGQRQKLADMQKAYDQMDAAMRESEGGRAFLEALKEQSDAVKELEETTGRAQRNVGNYPKAWEGAVPIFGKIEKTLSNLGVSMQSLQAKGAKAFSGLGQSVKSFGKAFITPPIIVITAVLSAIMLVVNKVQEAFKKNDAAMTALQKAFAIFKPIGEAVAKVFEAVANGLGKVAEYASKAVMWIAEKLAPSYAAAAKEAQNLVERQDELQEKEREYAVNSAKRSAEVAELRDKATQSEKYTLEERRNALESAIKLEQENLKEQKAIVAERLALLQAEAKQNADTSDEMKDKIAEARAAMYQAEEAYYSGTRRLNAQLTAFDKEERQKRQAAADKEKRRREKEQKEREERIKNTQDIAQMVEDFTLSLIKDEGARQLAERKIQGEREIKALQERLKKETNLTKESREMLEQLIKDKQAALYTELDEMAEAQIKAKEEAELQAEQEKARRILELRLELAEEDSAAELEIQQQLFELQLEQELANTELSEEEKFLIRQTYEKKAEKLNEEYAENVRKTAEDAKNGMKSSLMAMAGAAADAFGTIADLLGEYAEDNEDAAKAQKAFALGSIIINQAMAIASGAQGIAAAMAGAAEAAAATGPAAPFTLIAFQAQMVGQVLAIVASVASTIAQAKQLFAQADAGKFSGGGTIKGNSYTGDKLIAHVNSGEGIYTGTQANNLLQEIANNPARGGFDYEAFGATIASAVAELPPPVMVYDEFRQFEKDVINYNEIASI